MKLLIALALAASASAGEPMTAAERKLHIESFEQVWKTVLDRHWDRNYNGVDWQAVHDELRPQIEKVESAEEARHIMAGMLGRLRQTHFGIIPAEEYAGMDPGPNARDGAPGIDVRYAGGRVLVTSVVRGSPAERAGIRTGWEITAIDGVDVAPAVERILERVPQGPRRSCYLRASTLARLLGRQGSECRLRLRNGHDELLDVAMTRGEPRGTGVRLWNLPPVRVWFESRKLGTDVAYFAFDAFLDPENLLPRFGEAVKSCDGNCRGFVIDLRGNGGGLGMMASGMVGWLVQEKVSLGTVIFRESSLKLIAYPRLEPYTGPVAVLIDECSGSAAEFLAGGLRDLGRARIFGSRSLGAALPSVIEKLPNGDGFQYAFADYVSGGGRPLEGEGVLPDVEVEHTRESLLAGRDAPLEAALEWIRQAGKE